MDDSGAALGLTTVADHEALPDGTDWLVLDDPAFRTECRGWSSDPVTDATVLGRWMRAIRRTWSTRPVRQEIPREWWSPTPVSPTSRQNSGIGIR